MTWHLWNWGYGVGSRLSDWWVGSIVNTGPMVQASPSASSAYAREAHFVDEYIIIIKGNRWLWKFQADLMLLLNFCNLSYVLLLPSFQKVFWYVFPIFDFHWNAALLSMKPFNFYFGINVLWLKLVSRVNIKVTSTRSFCLSQLCLSDVLRSASLKQDPPAVNVNPF